MNYWNKTQAFQFRWSGTKKMAIFQQPLSFLCFLSSRAEAASQSCEGSEAGSEAVSEAVSEGIWIKLKETANVL